VRDVPHSTTLITRVGGCRCALPLAHVVETMRRGAVEPIAGAPTAVLGIATIRGEAVPVVDLGRLLGVEGAVGGRLVTVDTGGRRVALAVDGVDGVRDLADDATGQLPPLLREAAAEVVAAVGRLDGDLLLVLRGARLVPEALWPALAAVGAP
jgi:purine-binding chemotaxis protein CheW